MFAMPARVITLPPESELDEVLAERGAGREDKVIVEATERAGARPLCEAAIRMNHLSLPRDFEKRMRPCNLFEARAEKLGPERKGEDGLVRTKANSGTALHGRAEGMRRLGHETALGPHARTLATAGGLDLEERRQRGDGREAQAVILEPEMNMWQVTIERWPTPKRKQHELKQWPPIWAFVLRDARSVILDLGRAIAEEPEAVEPIEATVVSESVPEEQPEPQAEPEQPEIQEPSLPVALAAADSILSKYNALVAERDTIRAEMVAIREQLHNERTALARLESSLGLAPARVVPLIENASTEAASDPVAEYLAAVESGDRKAASILFEKHKALIWAHRNKISKA